MSTRLPRVRGHHVKTVIRLYKTNPPIRHFGHTIGETGKMMTTLTLTFPQRCGHNLTRLWLRLHPDFPVSPRGMWRRKIWKK